MSQNGQAGISQNKNLQTAEEAEGRGQLAELRQKLIGDATRQMLVAAHLKPGDQILDIAAGTGDQSRHAARLVEPGGSVLATDISQEMLNVAARQAREEGLSNVTTRVMNAEQLDLAENSYDAAISRLGLMLISDQTRALAHIQRGLKPGGRLAALVWSRRERNPLFALYIGLVEKYLGEMEPDPFSLADATHFANALKGAGFRQVQVRPVALTFQFPSYEVLTNWWGDKYDAILATLEPEPRRRLLEEIRHTLREFEGPQGIQAPEEFLLGVGVK